MGNFGIFTHPDCVHRLHGFSMKTDTKQFVTYMLCLFMGYGVSYWEFDGKYSFACVAVAAGFAGVFVELLNIKAYLAAAEHRAIEAKYPNID